MAKSQTLEVQEQEQIQQPAQNEALEKAKAEIDELKKQLAAAQEKPKVPQKRESDYDRIHRLEKEAIAAGKDLWNEMVELLVPSKKNTSEDPWYWINVNGRSAQIPANDEVQEMRLPWACVLVDTIRAERIGNDYKDSLKVYDPKVNPHKEENIRSGS